MKKKVLFLFIMFFFLISFVEASKCTVVSGSKEIGSEVDCGGEHFYIIDNDGTNVKMLAKYNLLAGRNTIRIILRETVRDEKQLYEKEPIQEKMNEGYIFESMEHIDGSTYVIMYKDASRDYKYINKGNTPFEEIYMQSDVKKLINDGYIREELRSDNYLLFVKDEYYEVHPHMLDECIEYTSLYQIAQTYFPEFFELTVEEGYNHVFYNNESTNQMKVCGMSAYKKRDVGQGIIKQDKKALGAHGKTRGVAEFPEYGSFVVQEYGTTDEIENDIYEAKQNGNYENSNYIDFELNSNSYWKRTLNSYQSYLSSLGIEVKETTILTITDLNKFAKKAIGKELPLSEWEQDWETVHMEGHSESYIIGSLIDTLPEKYSWLWSSTYWTRTVTHNSGVYFVDVWGDMCNAYYCDADVGAGLRPVIVISANLIDYAIETKTDGHGQIKVEKVRAYGGEIIKFTVIPDEGYELGVVKVTDALGNVVYFKDYTFTMPNANVLIEATFVPKNPKTSDTIIGIAFIVLVVVGGLALYQHKVLKRDL